MAFEPKFAEFESIRIYEDAVSSGPENPCFEITNQSLTPLGLFAKTSWESAYAFVPHEAYYQFTMIELRDLSLALWALNTSLDSFRSKQEGVQ